MRFVRTDWPAQHRHPLPDVRAACAAVSVAFFALAACAPLKPQPSREAPPAAPAAKAPPPVNLSGYSPAFKAGFADGCETARGNARRDDERFRADQQYARGWDDGKAICGKR